MKSRRTRITPMRIKSYARIGVREKEVRQVPIDEEYQYGRRKWWWNFSGEIFAVACVVLFGIVITIL